MTTALSKPHSDCFSHQTGVQFPGLEIKPEGWIVGGRYIIDTLTSKSVFGDVWAGTNTASGEKIEIRVASGEAGHQLWKTVSICETLAGCPGFPFIRDCYGTGDNCAMVYDALGPSLEDSTIQLKTILLIFYQLIARLKYMHGKLLVHGDIRPGDLRMGYGMRSNQVVVTNIRTSRDKKSASMEQSRLDDMEWLGHLVIYWLRRLPWQDVVEEDRILEMKETPVETLCLKCLPEFEIYLNYTRSLGLDEKLDYDYLRDLVRRAIDRHGFVWDYRRGPESQVSQEELVADFINKYDDLAQEAAKKCAVLDWNLYGQKLFEQDVWRRAMDTHLGMHDRFHYHFAISQHPSASQGLRRLARSEAMPERLWSGIHSFLELLRHHLPASQDCMLSFGYRAYLAMVVFLEEFPDFDDTWLVSLGHISRYIYILGEKKFWDLAFSWYSKASNKYPEIGKFYWNLAITSPSPLQKFFYCCKALCAEVPIRQSDVQGDIMSSFDAILDGTKGSSHPLDTALLKAHAILFTGKREEHFELSSKEFLDLADSHPERITVHIAIINITAMLGYASEGSFLRRIVKRVDAFRNAQHLNNSTLKSLLGSTHANCILSFLYINLVFIYGMSHHPGAMHHVGFPWKLSSNLLNSLPVEAVNRECIEVLQLDKAMSGLYWAKNYLETANLEGKSLVERIRSLMNDCRHHTCSTSPGNNEMSTLSRAVKEYA